MKDCPPGVLCLNYSKLVLIILIGLFIIYCIKNEWQKSTTKILENNMNNVNKVIERENKILDTKIEEIKAKDKIEEIKQNQELDLVNLPSINYPIIANNPMYLINKSYERVINPLLPPERSNPYKTPYGNHLRGIGVPINIPTRGEVGEYQQVGALVSDKNDKILPIYGRQTYPGSSKWSYYTATDKFREVKLPVFKNKRNCTEEHGCDEIYDKDEIDVPAYNEKFKVTLYSLDTPKYIPYLPY